MLIKKTYCPRQDSNLQSPDPKSGAFSIRPHGLMLCLDSILYTIEYIPSCSTCVCQVSFFALLPDVDSRQSAKIDDRRALSQLVTRNCAFRPNFRQHCKSKGCPVYFYASKLLSVLVFRVFLLQTFGNKHRLLVKIF